MPTDLIADLILLAAILALGALVARITKEPQFIKKMRDMSIQSSFKDSATYQKAVFRDRDNLFTFFKEQGLYK